MTEITQPTFKHRCVISCGMLHPEITRLMETGFLNPRRILFTPPGLHALPDKLEEYLLKRLTQAREWCPDHKIIVVYGKKCYTNVDEPLRRVDSILQAHGQGIVRVQGDYGYDMLAGFEDRQRISGAGRARSFGLRWAGSRVGRRSTRSISAGMRQTLMQTFPDSTTRSSS